MTIRWMTIFIDLPADRFDAGVAFWSRVTACRLSAPRGSTAEFATLIPPSGDATLRVQRLAGTHPRSTRDGGCHLDLHIAGPDSSDGATDDAEGVGGAADRAVTLGARRRHAEPGLVVLDSPGGFSFCLVAWLGESVRPAPVLVDGIGPSSADQLCLDIPADRFDVECAFWQAFTGWPLKQIPDSEFGYLERAVGQPVRLLFQRRDASGPGDVVTGHLDLAAGDARRALADVHLSLGARDATPFAGGWTALVDPTGRPYCLTGRDPVTGRMAASFDGPDPLLA